MPSALPCAARRASYEWRYSLDGGKTWVPTAATLQTRTTVTGLTPGATVTFRYRAVTKRPRRCLYPSTMA
ncbi:MAG TPA: fibronectin type III domain-containing protein [Polyangiaceae bacterium]